MLSSKRNTEGKGSYGQTVDSSGCGCLHKLLTQTERVFLIKHIYELTFLGCFFLSVFQEEEIGMKREGINGRKDGKR